MADQIEIRALRPDDDLDAQRDLADRAFGPTSGDSVSNWLRMARIVVAAGTTRAAFDRGRPAGSAVYFDMRQWWHGRPVPMAGVSGVKVAPEYRGRGVGRRLMTELLGDIAERGYPLSVLYPATMPFYRAFGWEVAGARYTAEAPALALRTLVPPDLGDQGEGPEIRQVTPADAGAINDVVGRILARNQDSGPITWTEAVNAVVFDRTHLYAYLCDDGFTWYQWYDGNDGIFLGGVQAGSASTARALWSLIASHGTIADRFRFLTHPGDPIWHLAGENDVEFRSSWHWMLRVVDAPAAIAARGFPAPVSVDVPLIIVDQHRPGNAGGWMLTVTDGKGELVRRGADDGALTLGARGLAALYGGTPLASLRIAGLARGGDADADAALDAAFRAAPYLLDSF